jgi:hypothetical protein
MALVPRTRWRIVWGLALGLSAAGACSSSGGGAVDGGGNGGATGAGGAASLDAAADGAADGAAEDGQLPAHALVAGHFVVPAGACMALTATPVQVPRSTLAFDLVDDAPGTDVMEIGIVPPQAGCNFLAAIVDVQATGSASASGPAPAGTYNLTVVCRNAAPDCAFNLTWTASY